MNIIDTADGRKPKCSDSRSVEGRPLNFSVISPSICDSKALRLLWEGSGRRSRSCAQRAPFGRGGVVALPTAVWRVVGCPLAGRGKSPLRVGAITSTTIHRRPAGMRHRERPSQQEVLGQHRRLGNTHCADPSCTSEAATSAVTCMGVPMIAVPTTFKPLGSVPAHAGCEASSLSAWSLLMDSWQPRARGSDSSPASPAGTFDSQTTSHRCGVCRMRLVSHSGSSHGAHAPS